MIRVLDREINLRSCLAYEHPHITFKRVVRLYEASRVLLLPWYILPCKGRLEAAIYTSIEDR